MTDRSRASGDTGRATAGKSAAAGRTSAASKGRSKNKTERAGHPGQGTSEAPRPSGSAAEFSDIVARSAHAICDKRLTWGKDAGDSSLRDPETRLIYILPRPSEQLPIPSWDVITAKHVAVVDIDGRTVGPVAWNRPPSC
jgi:hypothetical protein